MTALAMRKMSVANVKSILKSKMDSATFNAWILPLEISEHDGKIILVAASKFNRDFIQATFGNILSDIKNEINSEIELSFKRPELRVIKNPGVLAVSAVKKCTSSFNGFIASENNQFALSAIKKCASGAVSFSPLVIHGASGSGKTLLLDMLGKNSVGQVVMMTGAEFVTEFVRAVQKNSIFAFKDMTRKCDTFIMDDIQHLAGKKASAEEFMSLVSDLVRMGKNVVLSSDITPSRITGFDRRLVSILASGLSVDLALPDVAVREKILLNAGVPGIVAKSLASRTPANGHILAGVSKKIAAWMELGSGLLDESVLEKLVGDVMTEKNTPLAMVKKCSANLGVSFDAVMSKSRTHAIVFARQKIMAALKMSTDLSLAEIGRVVGGRDHASVLYALGQIEKAKETDMLLESEIRELIG